MTEDRQLADARKEEARRFRMKRAGVVQPSQIASDLVGRGEHSSESFPGHHDEFHTHAAEAHGMEQHTTLKVSKSIIFTSPADDLAVGDWLPDQGVRVPAAGKHGTWTAGTIYVRVGTAGTGTNTILFRTSTTLAGARTTRATVNLDTAQEASAAITWTPVSGEYMWVEGSAVGATVPQKGVAQVDIEEEVY